MKTINKLLLTVLMCSVMSMPFARAEEHQDRDHHFKGKGRAKIFDQLNLTEDQKKQLEANKKAQREGMKSSFEQMKALRQELKQELMKPELDMNKINSINTQLKGIQSQMADNRINSILEVRKILTPEQFSQFLSKMEERHEKWMNKKKHEHSNEEK